MAWRGRETRSGRADPSIATAATRCMIPKRGSKLPVTRSLAAELAPDAAAFYPGACRPGRFAYRDLLGLSVVGLGGGTGPYGAARAHDRPAVADPALDHQLPRQLRDPPNRDRPACRLRARAGGDGGLDLEPAGRAGHGDAEAGRPDRLQAAGRADRPPAQAARRAVPQLHHGRPGRSRDGHRRDPEDSHRTHPARLHGVDVLHLQRRPDALLRCQARRDRPRC